MHLAYHADEWTVLQELYELFIAQGRQVILCSKDQVAAHSSSVIQKNLLGGLYSKDEMIIDPRHAIASLPKYLNEKLGIEFYWGKCVTYVSEQTVYIGNKEEYSCGLHIYLQWGGFLKRSIPKHLLNTR